MKRLLQLLLFVSVIFACAQARASYVVIDTIYWYYPYQNNYTKIRVVGRVVLEPGDYFVGTGIHNIWGYGDNGDDRFAYWVWSGWYAGWYTYDALITTGLNTQYVDVVVTGKTYNNGNVSYPWASYRLFKP